MGHHWDWFEREYGRVSFMLYRSAGDISSPPSPPPPTVQEVKQRAIEIICERLMLAQNNPTACQKEFCETCGWLIGAAASVQTPQETLKGTIEGLTSDGYLRLLTESKKSVTIPQGVLTLI